MNEEPLISVIVPIYNVKPYLKQCLDSLKKQTMKEIEIICIDDGSTDGSGAIADEYKSQELPVFRVIHTENRGLSASRNRGLDEARAKWIMFVDSDDWVEPDFCKIPYEAAMENDADLEIFGAHKTDEKGKVKKNKTDHRYSGIVSADSVIWNGAVWNKLYKKKLFAIIRYPEGRLYEDVLTTHKIIHTAKRIHCCKEKLYYYRKRIGSITQSTSSRADAYFARVCRYEDLVNFGYVKKEDKTLIQEISLDYCGQAKKVDDPLYQKAVETVKTINGIPDEFDIKHRLKLLLWRTNRNIYRRIYRVLGKQM